LSAVVETVPLTVAEPEATLAAPAEITAGAMLTVVWTGPAHPGDRIVIAGAGAADADAAVAVRVSAFGRDAITDAPAVPGDYEIRYIAGGTTVLARRPITVTAPEITMA